MKRYKISIPIIFIFFFQYSFSFAQKDSCTILEKEIRINDSTLNAVKSHIYLEKHQSFIVIDTLNNVKYFYGFFKDGITPSYFTKTVKDSCYKQTFRYYPTGQLNQKYSFKNGRLDGWYIIYNNLGEMIYKSFYKNGIIKSTVINELKEDSPQFIEEK